MMEKRIAILGGDKRFSILAQQMVHDGHKIMTYGHENDCAAYEVQLDEAVTAEYIVLPLPLARLEADLNGRKDCTMEQLWSKFHPGQKIYAGNIREKDRECAGMHGLRLVDYYTDEALAIRNAVPTAEGAIAAAMSATDITLQRARCLVMGYGRIGKVLAQKLAALGAKVSVSARRKTDLAWIETMGFEAVHSYSPGEALGKFHIIFNTVPHELLDAEEIAKLRSDCVLIELASCPGFDLAAVKRRGITHITAAALPGKAAPKSAAEAICKTLYSLWEESE